MDKTRKAVVVFIVFLTFVVLLVLSIKTPVDMMNQSQEVKVAGFLIQFENRTTEPEVNTILENCNLTMNYSIDYNSNIGRGMYYIKVDEDRINELRNNENWNSEIELKKGNYNIIMFSEEFVPDENFLITMEKNNLQLKKSIVCNICLGDGSNNYILGKNCILESDAIRIKNELETNEKVLIVGLNYIDG